MHSKDVIDKHLKKLKKLDYNQFRWWRNYQVQKPLPKSTHIEKRINSGDFEPSPYFWMAQSVLWEKYDNDNLNLEDFEEIPSIFKTEVFEKKVFPHLLRSVFLS